MMSMTVALRKKIEKKRWGNGSYFSHGKFSAAKRARRKSHRRAVRQALAAHREIPLLKPCSGYDLL